MQTKFKLFIASCGVIAGVAGISVACQGEQQGMEIADLITSNTLIGEVQGNNYVIKADQTELISAFTKSAEDEGLHPEYDYLWIGESNDSGSPTTYALFARDQTGDEYYVAAADLTLRGAELYLASGTGTQVNCKSICAVGCQPRKISGEYICDPCRGRNYTCTKTVTKTFN